MTLPGSKGMVRKAPGQGSEPQIVDKDHLICVKCKTAKRTPGKVLCRECAQIAAEKRAEFKRQYILALEAERAEDKARKAVAEEKDGGNKA